MLKATLFAALYGISHGYGDAAAPRMCCSAGQAMSNSYSVCEDVMNRFSDPADQREECLNGKYTGMTDGMNTCEWGPCEDVGYCVDEKDSEYFDEMAAWEAEASERRSLLSIDSAALHANGWGNGRPMPTPRPTKTPKTPRPTMWKAPPTPRPTNTPKPTNPPKTPRPTMTPKPTNPPKTPKPTVWKAPPTPRPTKTPKTPRPTMIKTPRPTKTPKPTMVKTPRPTKSYVLCFQNANMRIVQNIYVHVNCILT